MKFEYDRIVTHTAYEQKIYKFRGEDHFSLLALLNSIGKNGWELVGEIEEIKVVKRVIENE